MGTDIEVLAVGNCYLEESEQDPALKTRYETSFEMD
jgi:carbamoyltransferase